MSPRPDVSEERKPQIIEAAVRVFARKGYRKATMPAIAREAGLSVGGMYWYFKSKEEMVRTIMEQCFQNDAQALQALVDSGVPVRERIQTFMARYIQNFTESAWINPIMIEFYAEAPYDSEVRAFVEHYLGRYRQALVAIIQQGIDLGEIRPVDPVDAANAFIGLEEGLVLLLHVDPRNLHWRETFTLGMNLLVDGLYQTEVP